MFKNYLKISTIVVFCAFGLFNFIVGCKNAADPLGHQGPFDVPTATPTVSGGIPPTATATLGPVNVSCYVNYGGNQTGISWNLLDPNGNTLNSTAQFSGGTPFLFTPAMDGVYSAQIPTQGRYAFSSQPLTIAGSGNYSVTFKCSGQTILANPSFLSYSSQIGYQVGPVTISYSSLGNLNVPVSIQTSGLSSSFSASPSYTILNNSGASVPLTISKTGCAVSNNSLNFTAYDLLGGGTGATSSTSIQRSYSIPVSFLVSTSNVSCGSIGNVYTVTVNDGSLSCGSYSFSVFNSNDTGAAQTYFSTVISSTPAYLNIQNYDPCAGINNSQYSFTLPGGVVLNGTISSTVLSDPGVSYVIATGSY